MLHICVLFGFQIGNIHHQEKEEIIIKIIEKFSLRQRAKRLI